MIKQLEYIQEIYVSNLCKGIDKAILDYSSKLVPLIKGEESEVKPTEEVKLEEIKEEVQKEAEALVNEAQTNEKLNDFYKIK
jgi:23S rRNA pseudoU1915 N3-methylase RlmH